MCKGERMGTSASKDTSPAGAGEAHDKAEGAGAAARATRQRLTPSKFEVGEKTIFCGVPAPKAIMGRKREDGPIFARIPPGSNLWMGRNKQETD